MPNDIQSLTDRFAAAIEAVVVERINTRLRDVMAISMISPTSVPFTASNGVKKLRRKAAPQLCPVPRCESRAAPAFGMLCAKHKDTPKEAVAKYRAARRAKKATHA